MLRASGIWASALCKLLFDDLIKTVLNRDCRIATAHPRKHMAQFTRTTFGLGDKERIERTLFGPILPDANFAFAADHFRGANPGFEGFFRQALKGVCWNWLERDGGNLGRLCAFGFFAGDRAGGLDCTAVAQFTVIGICAARGTAFPPQALSPMVIMAIMNNTPNRRVVSVRGVFMVKPGARTVIRNRLICAGW